MGMTRKQAQEIMVERLRQGIERAGNFTCTCCQLPLMATEFSHVAIYEPKSDVMKRLVRADTLATYLVCKECARLPEEAAFLKAEQYLVKRGLLRQDLKPLDVPGGQSHRHGPNCSHGKKSGEIFPGRG